jgi:hypothetical protein
MNIPLVMRVAVSLAVSSPFLVSAQGTMVFDQQSSDETNAGSSGNIIQNVQPTGQSFTPSLDGVGFVRLQFFDFNGNNGVGATVYVNLRSDSITGPIVDSTAPVALPDNFGLPLNSGFVTFFFPTEVPLQPGTKYYFQPVVQSGDQWVVAGGSFNYPGGDLYANGTAFSSDYWFREGIVVPEPSSCVLLLCGAALCFRFRHAKR